MGVRNRKQAKETVAVNGSYPGSPWLWLTEQVKNTALGRGCWLEARLTSTAAGRSDPASIKRMASRGSSLHRSDGARGPPNFTLTSVLPLDDGWHLRDWNCTVQSWCAIPNFQGVGEAEPLSLTEFRIRFNWRSLPSVQSSNTAVCYLFIYSGIVLLACGSMLNLQFRVNMVYHTVDISHAFS